MAYHYHYNGLSLQSLLIKNLIDINLQRKFEHFLPFKANRELHLSQIS